MVCYNKQAVACLLVTHLSSSFFGRVVVQAHEETEVHDEYDDHTHEEISRLTGGHGDAEGGGVDSWSYLDTIILPSPLSDLSIAKMTLNEDQMAIVLTGGCNSPNGNELVMEDWGEGFSCMNITSQVSTVSHMYLLCYLSLFLFVYTHTHHPILFLSTVYTGPCLCTQT